ncbi:MAG: hypothetical protein KME43_11280 [Myxacorys chilensis ATA2-1-KO14]|jgi:hypothetical protein|nr:hypothetical protein [Myxacorys chilensis ATA2-1-KO14]
MSKKKKAEMSETEPLHWLQALEGAIKRFDAQEELREQTEKHDRDRSSDTVERNENEPQ